MIEKDSSYHRVCKMYEYGQQKDEPEGFIKFHFKNSAKRCGELKERVNFLLDMQGHQALCSGWLPVQCSQGRPGLISLSLPHP